MSFFNTLPIIGPSCSRRQFSVLIVSSNKLYTEYLSKVLCDVHLEMNNRWLLSVHTSDGIKSILNHLRKIGPISIDFVIVCMDTSKIQCTDWTDEVIRQCHSDLRLGRIVLVNGSGLPTLEMAMSLDLVIAIKRKYNLQLINGNLLLKRDLQNVAKRIHIIINTVMGLKVGLPHVVNS